MSPALNLTDYDEPQSYDAVPPGKYFATIFDADDRETAGSEGAKMPEGTPYIWVHLMLTGKVGETEQGEDSPYHNKRVFRNLVVPPEDYDEKKRKAMNGMIVSLFRAVGYTEEEITSGEFNVDTEDLIEKNLVVQVSRRQKKMKDENDKWVASGEFENPVTGFFSVEAAAGEEAAASAAVL